MPYDDKPWMKKLKDYVEKDDDSILHHYIKNKKGYFINAFFGVHFFKFLLLSFVSLFLFFITYLFKKNQNFDRSYFYNFSLVFMTIAITYWIIGIIENLWFWKYSKHVVITEQGIYVMLHNSFWWGKRYDGKKHFWNAHWSMYAWQELNGVFEFKSRISKLSKLMDFEMDRWDGKLEVHYLKPEEVENIVKYSKLKISPHRRKKKRDKKPPYFKIEWSSGNDD